MSALLANVPMLIPELGIGASDSSISLWDLKPMQIRLMRCGIQQQAGSEGQGGLTPVRPSKTGTIRESAYYCLLLLVRMHLLFHVSAGFEAYGLVATKM